MKIALIEDNEKTAEIVRIGLEKAGWSCHVYLSPQSGIPAVATGGFDAIILDRMLPDMDGIDALRLMRGINIAIPILMLTARSSTQDRVIGLESGADDYLVKPFAMAELIARMRLITRRSGKQSDDVADLKIGDLTLDRVQRRAFRGDTLITLSPTEFRLLEQLVLCQDTVVSRKILLEKVWGYQFDPSTSIVETHMSRLRGKVDKPFDTAIIQTIKGTGYMATGS